MLSIVRKSFQTQAILKQALACSLSSQASSNKNVAMVLSGSGVYDGTEIIEACSTIIHLSKHNANISFFAPNIEQLHVINHASGEVQPEVR